MPKQRYTKLPLRQVLQGWCIIKAYSGSFRRTWRYRWQRPPRGRRSPPTGGDVDHGKRRRNRGRHFYQTRGRYTIIFPSSGWLWHWRIIVALTALTKWRNLLRHYARLRSSLLRTTAGTRVESRALRTWFKFKGDDYCLAITLLAAASSTKPGLRVDVIFGLQMPRLLLYRPSQLPPRHLSGENGRFVKRAFFTPAYSFQPL